ncbi:MAG: flotillin family protein [Deltaproteobacteria bacterium]|nr:flotillin family protein [Deltaproteobacteria bacterium]
MGQIALVLAITVLVVVLFIVYTLKNLLLIATPSQVLVLAGGIHRAGDRAVGYRAVRGGRAVRLPLFETAFWMDLSNISVEISVKGAFSKGGVPLNVQGVALVKLPGEEPRLANAIERFLGRTRAEIAQVARETLEGNVRGVLAQLTPEQVNEDKVAFSNQLLDEAEHDMVRVGLVLDTLKIQNVTDEANYLNSIGRIRGATIRQDASIAEAQAQADAAEQKARNWAASEIAKVKADLAIAEQETARRVMEGETGREAKIAEAVGRVQAEIAKVEEDIKRQKERALQVERQLDADVIKPSDAERQKLEQKARADAARIAERGRAEAEGLGKLIDEFHAAGPAAAELLALQQLLPLAGAIAGAGRKTHIAEWAVVPCGAGTPGGLIPNLISASEQLRAATGIDLAGAARRLGAGPGAEPGRPAPGPEKKEG